MASDSEQQKEAASEAQGAVHDDAIVKEIETVLNSVDLATTSMSGIYRKLEQNLGLDLSDRKAFVREQVDSYLEKNVNLGSLAKSEDGEGVEAEIEAGGEAAEEKVEAGAEAEPNDGEKLQQAEEALPNDQELEQFRENIELAIEDSTPKEKKKRGGLNKVCRLSPELQAIIGEEFLPRTQVVKQLWVYIRAHNLQDPENKRNIICDDALRELFGQDSTDMFQMNKLLSKHITSMNEEGGADDEPRAKKQKVAAGKGKASGFLVPSPISDALQKFFGTGESEIPRGEVVKRLWDYIRNNQLQDPTDKRKILCDNKLQELFECDSFVGFSMTKLLASHFVKT